MQNAAWNACCGVQQRLTEIVSELERQRPASHNMVEHGGQVSAGTMSARAPAACDVHFQRTQARRGRDMDGRRKRQRKAGMLGRGWIAVPAAVSRLLSPAGPAASPPPRTRHGRLGLGKLAVVAGCSAAVCGCLWLVSIVAFPSAADSALARRPAGGSGRGVAAPVPPAHVERVANAAVPSAAEPPAQNRVMAAPAAAEPGAAAAPDPGPGGDQQSAGAPTRLRPAAVRTEKPNAAIVLTVNAEAGRQQGVPFSIGLVSHDGGVAVAALLISGLPAGARLSVGEEVQPGRWAVSPHDIDQLRLIASAGRGGRAYAEARSLPSRWDAAGERADATCCSQRSCRCIYPAGCR